MIGNLPTGGGTGSFLWPLGGVGGRDLTKWLGVAVLLILGVAARADTLAEMHQRGTLRWGGDATGGAPYIIDPGQGMKPTGFEAELAEYLADRLNLKSQ